MGRPRSSPVLKLFEHISVLQQQVLDVGELEEGEEGEK
jgi:hypothetical protein